MDKYNVKIHDIKFNADKEELSGRIITSSKSKSGILFLHGAGKATKERSQPIAMKLAEEYGINSFLFDFSGHGASTGSMECSSLLKRIEEAKKAFQASGFAGSITICAFSMGGHIALELLDTLLIQNIILFYPAVYSDLVNDIPFGNHKFSEMIRKENSWESSKTFNKLKLLNGDLLIFIGENDEVIPKKVPEKILDNATTVKKKELRIFSNAPHLLLPIILQDEVLFSEVCKKIANCFYGD